MNLLGVLAKFKPPLVELSVSTMITVSEPNSTNTRRFGTRNSSNEMNESVIGTVTVHDTSEKEKDGENFREKLTRNEQWLVKVRTVKWLL
jgi:hypothetical protein